VSQVTIENPILNSPFQAPARHFRFNNDGITTDIEEKRRASAFFMPIAHARKKGEQALLEYWSDPARERKLFFCQREAVETAVYLAEVAPDTATRGSRTTCATRIASTTPGCPASRSRWSPEAGRPWSWPCSSAWQALNKLENRQDARFSDAFLMVTPGITIRDRLRVLLPTDPGNYYRQRDVLPPDLLERLGQARITITNYHSFLLREKGEAARLTKSILNRGDSSPFQENPDQMVRRVCRDLAGKKNIIVINDEAHHCYWRKADAEDETLSPEERAEAKRREEGARVWSSGLLAVQKKLGVRGVYDLSATPFFLSGSGYPEGTLFPWWYQISR